MNRWEQQMKTDRDGLEKSSQKGVRRSGCGAPEHKHLNTNTPNEATFESDIFRSSRKAVAIQKWLVLFVLQLQQNRPTEERQPRQQQIIRRMVI